ncbi:MAG: hypothetical protein SP4CHLAM5_05940 [Chlamydiia bacterium]|nr:hypothetical protein [Chlamydiia bacterium]MCH9618463.1 hypothetical protein [Chlamydiia bacterium]MCH9623925.1 hypothetical protein [Chlamydiia bacterium]
MDSVSKSRGPVLDLDSDNTPTHTTRFLMCLSSFLGNDPSEAVQNVDKVTFIVKQWLHKGEDSQIVRPIVNFWLNRDSLVSHCTGNLDSRCKGNLDNLPYRIISEAKKIAGSIRLFDQKFPAFIKILKTQIKVGDEQGATQTFQEIDGLIENLPKSAHIGKIFNLTVDLGLAFDLPVEKVIRSAEAILESIERDYIVYAQVRLAKLYHAASKTEEAKKAIKSAEACKELLAHELISIASTKAVIDDKEAARETFNRAISMINDQADPLCKYSQLVAAVKALNKAGFRGEAKETFNTLKKIIVDPKNLANGLARFMKLKELLTDITVTKELFVGQEEVLDTISQIKSGLVARPKDAVNPYGQILDLYEIAVAQRNLGDTKGFEETFKLVKKEFMLFTDSQRHDRRLAQFVGVLAKAGLIEQAKNIMEDITSADNKDAAQRDITSAEQRLERSKRGLTTLEDVQAAVSDAKHNNPPSESYKIVLKMLDSLRRL